VIQGVSVGGRIIHSNCRRPSLDFRLSGPCLASTMAGFHGDPSGVEVTGDSRIPVAMPCMTNPSPTCKRDPAREAFVRIDWPTRASIQGSQPSVDNWVAD
jgi:hypothetical protein